MADLAFHRWLHYRLLGLFTPKEIPPGLVSSQQSPQVISGGSPCRRGAARSRRGSENFKNLETISDPRASIEAGFRYLPWNRDSRDRRGRFRLRRSPLLWFSSSIPPPPHVRKARSPPLALSWSLPRQ